MASDRMMEYYYSMGQDSYAMGNVDDAVAYFKKAANMGAMEAAHEIGVIARRLETGEDLKKDEARAERCYRIAGELGIERAWLYLGKLYLRGINGARPNPRKAKKALEHASDAGIGEASALLGKLYDEGIMGKANYKMAFQYYLTAAERGDADSMLMCGLFYAQGDHVPKDLTAAEHWIRKGKETGSSDADETLRVFLSVACTEYVSGQAGVVDIDRAFAMAEEAEKLGDKEAVLHLGEALLRSRAEGHSEKAYECFRRASRKKIPAAWANMGFCLDMGIGVEADVRKAVRYYKKAAEAGDTSGMAHYGYALATGAGARKNEQKAMQWLIEAAMKGEEGAITFLREEYDYEI